MLNALRTQASGFFMKAFLALIVLSFAVWGIGDVFRGRGATEVAWVGGTPITVQTFRDSFNRELQQAGSRFGRPLSIADARALGLDRQVLSELMAEATLDEQAQNLRLVVPDSAVVDTIMKDQSFAGPNGAFDASRFDAILRANGMTEPMFVAAQKRFMARRQIIEGVAGGVPVPEALISAVNQHQNERRTASYIVLPGAPGADIAEPDEATLKSFYEERKGTFQEPERRSLTVLPLTTESLAAKQTVSDEDVAARYEQDKARLGTPERRTIERITFPTIEEANEASAKIKGGMSFEDLATARNVAASDLSLGTTTKAEMIDRKLADAAFALPQGQVSDPIQGDFSTAIIRVTAIEPEVVRSLDEVKEELRRAIASERAADQVLTIHDQIEDARASGSTLAEIAGKFALQATTVEQVDRDGKDPAGQAVTLPGGQEVLTAAFQSDVGVENDPVQGQGGSFYWYDVTKVDPARARTFEEARADIATRWKAEEARKRLDANVDQAVADLKAGTLTLPALAEREGVTVLSADRIDRRGGPLFGRSAAAAVFSTPNGGFGSAPAQNDTDRVIFQVVQIDAPAEGANAPFMAQVREELGDTLQNDLASQLVMQLQNDLGATINGQALATALGGTPEN